MPRIAIDAMGGDKAPAVVVQGAWRVASEQPEWQILLVGDEAAISAELAKCEKPLSNIHVIHTPEVIGMEEHPVEALKSKKNASLPVAVGLVREGKADAVISAGNTGALVAAGTLMLAVKVAGVTAEVSEITEAAMSM